MSAVTGLDLVSSLGQVKITIERRWTGQRAEVADLPADMRVALLQWLGVKGNGCQGCGAPMRSFCSNCAEDK